MESQHPPKIADKLLKWFCAEEYFEEVQGDLHEWFYQRVEEGGYAYARRYYYLDVIRYFRSFRLKRSYRLNNNSKFLYMQSLFKHTFRNLRRDGLSALLRIGNLSLGIVVCLLTLIYARYELSYDTFHNDHERIYRMGQAIKGSTWAAGPIGLGAYLASDVPEAEAVTRVFPVRNTSIKRDDKIFNENDGYFVDQEFFELFNHKVVRGKLEGALTDIRSIVLTEALAIKYFGNENPVGQMLALDNEQGKTRIVSAVIANVPQQTHLKFDFLLPITTFGEDFTNRWRNFGTYTYVRLSEGTDLQKFKETVKDEFETRYPNQQKGTLQALVTPINDIHLKTNYEKELADNGNINYVYILLSAGLLVLLIACINFANLSVIKGLDRSKEVGLRKAIGASKLEVVVQFLGENLITIMLAALISLLVLAGLTPIFKNFSELDLPLNVFNNPDLLLPIGLLVIVLGLTCSLYPAIVLSRFSPIVTLKSTTNGVLRHKPMGRLRQALIMMQFGISLILIIGSFLIYNQVDYIQNRDMGFEKDQLLTINLDGKIRANFSALRDELMNVAGVKAVTASSDVPGYRISMEPVLEVGVSKPGSPENIRTIRSDNQFLSAYGVDIKEGRDFRNDLPEGVTEYILNESAAEFIFEGRDPLSGSVVYRRDTGRVVGIIKDFNYKTIHSKVEPLVISSNAQLRLATIRFDPQSTATVLEGMENVGSTLFPDLPPIDYEFVSDHFAYLYKAETRLKTLIWMFCIISMILTLSGIFGLTTYMARQKTREIAIRKVLGSNVSQLFGLMSRGFVLLLISAIVVAIPIAWYLAEWWLQNFAYQVSVRAVDFIASTLGVCVLVLFSSGLVTLRAIRANPTAALKGD